MRGAWADSTYVRTRIPPLSHIRPADDSGTEATKKSTRARVPAERMWRLLLGSRRIIPQRWRGWLAQHAGPLGRTSHAATLLEAIAGVLVAVLILVRFGRDATWVVLVLALVLVVTGIWRVTKHYMQVHTAAELFIPARMEASRHIVIVPLSSLNQPALRCLTYARSITPEIHAVYVAMDAGREAAVRADWRAWVAAHRPLGEHAAVDERTTASGLDEAAPHRSSVARSPHPRLVVIESPAHALFPPLLAYIATIREHNLDATVTVILPEYAPAHWWERVFFDWTACRLKLALHHIPQVVVTSVPYSMPR